MKKKAKPFAPAEALAAYRLLEQECADWRAIAQSLAKTMEKLDLKAGPAALAVVK